MTPLLQQQQQPQPASTATANNHVNPQLTAQQWKHCIEYLDRFDLDATRFVRALEILETRGHLFLLMDDRNRRKLLRGYGVDI